VIVTAPLGERLAEAVSVKAAVSDTEMASSHYRIVGGDRLMWAGRSTVWPRNPQRYRRTLAAEIARAYPQLGPVEADFAWAGTLGNTMHRMPQIGELSPGVWVLSGFGGHGLNMTAMGGELVARGVVEGDRAWRLFAPFHLVWAGGAPGRALAQAYAWSYGRRERFDSWRARRRQPKAGVAEPESSVDKSGAPPPEQGTAEVPPVNRDQTTTSPKADSLSGS
jgi:gamma-glutamylputrescine oxidase